MYCGVYGNIEKDLIECNYFRVYKDRSCKMNYYEIYDITFGVLRTCIFSNNNRRHLFNDIYDWYRIKFIVEFIKFNFNIDVTEGKLNWMYLRHLMINHRR